MILGPARAQKLQDDSAERGASDPEGIRQKLQNAVASDLLGAAEGSAEEVVEASVRVRYLIGQLVPQNLVLEPDDQDELPKDGTTVADDGEAEEERLQSESGFLEAGFLMTWIALESAMHELVIAEAVELDRSAANCLIKRLYSVALITRTDRTLLERSWIARNQLAHGQTFPREELAEIDLLIELGLRLLQLANTRDMDEGHLG